MFVMSNISVGKNDKIIEIVHSPASAGCLKQTDMSGNLICCLPLCLSFGDLSTLGNYDRSDLSILFTDDIELFENKFNFKKEIDELLNYTSKAEKIRIWSSRSSAVEYLNFLYLCSILKDKEISVVFSDDYSEYCWSISCMDFKEVNKLVSKEHILTNEEKELYLEEWNQIVKENSDLRYIRNKKIHSVSIDYFDDVILDYLIIEGECKKISLIGTLIGNFVIDDSSDRLYNYLIDNLIKKGKIVITKIENDREYIKVSNN